MLPFLTAVTHGWTQGFPVDSFAFYDFVLPSHPSGEVYDAGEALRALRWIEDTYGRSTPRSKRVPDRYLSEALEAAYEAKFARRRR
jgi:hypothetical protein